MTGHNGAIASKARPRFPIRGSSGFVVRRRVRYHWIHIAVGILSDRPGILPYCWRSRLDSLALWSGIHRGRGYSPDSQRISTSPSLHALYNKDADQHSLDHET